MAEHPAARFLDGCWQSFQMMAPAFLPPVAAQSAETQAEPSKSSAHDDAGDRDLLRRISCADRDAFQQLYLDYHKRLARFLVRVTSCYDDLEEVINDALLIVWQRAGEFRGASRVSTWIFGIAYHRALKSIRRSKTRSRTIELEIRDGEAVVDDATRAAENRQLLELALASLPDEQRLVLVLAYYRDFSCEQIAAILDCPVNTVKSRMFHARRKLRTIISTIAAPHAIVREVGAGVSRSR